MIIPPLSITIPCLSGGVLFALLATILHTKKGNTISDILKSQKFSDSKALEIEIINKVKISTTIPIIALYIVAAFVALGLPAYIAFKGAGISPDAAPSPPRIITLNGNLVKDRDKQAYIYPFQMKINESGNFGVNIFYDRPLQTVNIESPFYDPVTMSFNVNTERNRIIVKYSGALMETDTVAIDTTSWTANLDRIVRLKSAEINFCEKVTNVITPASEVAAMPAAPPPPSAIIPGGNIIMGMGNDN